MRRHAHTQKGRQPSRLNRRLQIFFVLGCFLSIPCSSVAQESAAPMTLRDAVDTAITANLDLQSSGQEIEAARANRNAQQTNLLPTFNVTYQGVRTDSGVAGFAAGATPSVGDSFNLSTGFTQPLFQGFALINQYKVAE
ncbi:MAG: TolC family protein, partial [Desulfobacterales bacterium]